MANDIFAPPSDDELKMFAAPTEEELAPPAKPSIMDKLKGYGNSALEAGKGALQYTGQSMIDTARGLGQGITAGGSDEAIAALKASLPDSSGQDWKTLYRQFQQQEQAKNKAAEESSPILYKAGELGGMLLPAIATAGAAAPEEIAALTAGSLAKKAAVGAGTGAATGAVYGALGSEKGNLIGATSEEQQQLASDTASGATTGGILGGALHAAAPVVGAGIKAASDKIGSKLENYIADSPFWKQVGKAKDLGEEGTNLYSRQARYGDIGSPGLINKDTEATRDIVDRIYNVDQQLGQKVGESIDNATDAGVKIDLTDPMLQSVDTFKNLMNNDQTLMVNPKAQKLYDTIFQLEDSNLTPKEVQTLRSQVVDFADAVKQKDPNIAALGYQFQGQIGNLLKEAVPEYKLAADRFESFRRLVPETIISGGTPVDISGVRLGNLKNDEAKLFGKVKGMIQGSENPGFGTANEQETFKNFINGLDQFGKGEAERVKQGLIKEEDIPKLVDGTNEQQAKNTEALVRDKADTSALLQQAWRTNPQEGLTTSLKGSTLGRSSAMNIANKYGLYKNTISTPLNVTKKIYNASEDQLRGLADTMSQTPGLQSVGKTLQAGLDNKDTAGVNAAIFSILQNPQSRLLVNGEDNLNNEEEKK